MAADYATTAIAQQQVMGLGGQLQDVVEVHFETIPEGLEGYVRVPLTAGWEQAATAAVQARVTELKAVFSA